MKYGKLFKKYREQYGVQQEFTSNKCSGLSRNELISIAHNLYPNHKGQLHRYMNLNNSELAAHVYEAMREM